MGVEPLVSLVMWEVGSRRLLRGAWVWTAGLQAPLGLRLQICHLPGWELWEASPALWWARLLTTLDLWACTLRKWLLTLGQEWGPEGRQHLQVDVPSRQGLRPEKALLVFVLPQR